MIWEVRWKGSLFSKFMATAFSFWLYIKRKDLIILIRISWLYRISFTYNPTASFFRHKIVEWPWIQFKMRPMLFKKSCNLFYAYVFLRSVKLACWLLVCYVRFQQSGALICIQKLTKIFYILIFGHVGWYDVLHKIMFDVILVVFR